MRLIFVVLLAGLLPAEAPKLPEPYRSLVDLAQAAPPEFAADALLRVAESGKIKDRDSVADLVEQAFRLAAAAKFPVRMRGLPGTTTDTRSGFLSRAYDLKLDGVSLQSRAVRDMLAVDKAKARELFQEIPKFALAPLTCDDALVYDVSDFYQVLGAIANAAFSKEEQAKEQHIDFILDYLGQATSPAQLAPLAMIGKNAAATTEQREILTNRLDGMVARMPQGLVCKDGAAKLDRYWQSAAAKQLLEDGTKLRSSGDGRTYTESDRSTAEWQQRLVDFLSELDGWTPGPEESEADYYHEKCIVFEALIDLVPLGQQRDKLLADYVAFINHSSLQQESPVEWFMEPSSMLERIRHSSDGEIPKVLDLYQNSGNPTLTLEVALEKALGAKLPPSMTGDN